MGTIEPREVRLSNGAWCIVRAAAEADAPAMVAQQGHMIATDPNSVSEPGDKRRTLEEQRESIAAHAREDGQLMLVAILGRDASRAASEGGEGLLVGVLAFKAGDRRKVRHNGHFGI